MKCEEIEAKQARFVKNEMDLKELSDFLNHVDSCRSCYEELETYYTIEVALSYLDANKVEDYNIPLRLTKTLENARARVKREILLYRCFTAIIILLILVLAILVISMNFTDVTDGLRMIFHILFAK